ncbi:MAG TPA: hypothetical protein VIV66_22695 [Pyrinomonadaceae bacterium]
MSSAPVKSQQLSWKDLPFETRQQLAGKLRGLWGKNSDQQAFDFLLADKQQALLLLLTRLEAKALWHTVQRIENVYGLGGVGMAFRPWPMIYSTLARRSDFTQRFARHRHTSGGFYEKHRAKGALHFIFQEGNPRSWFVHFDLFSPVYSFASLSHHLRFEVFGGLRPDWQMIRHSLKP